MIENLKALRAQKTSLKLFEFKDGDPRRANPISIEQQKKLAKELLKQFKQDNSEAIERFRQIFTGSINGATLARAQHVIAQENGFKKWTDLKAFAEHSEISRKAIASGEPTALDHEYPTLHIRCGNDLMHALALAGFNGDFLAFADPYVQGPVINTNSLSDFLDKRIDFLMEDSYKEKINFKQLITQDYLDLEKAKSYDRVCIWLEHDSYDQLILAKLLHFFSDKHNRPKQLQMINITHFPGVKKFISIGSLPPEAMRTLWREFTDVTEAQLLTGKHAWEALTSPDPIKMHQLILSKTPQVPTLANAFHRHLRELPSTENGLSLTEQQTLQILLDKGSIDADKLFAWNNHHYEPLAYMGDLQYWRVLDTLRNSENPAITVEVLDSNIDDKVTLKEYNHRKHWHISLSPIGEKLLMDDIHWLKINTIKRWVGGTQIDTSTGKAWTIRRSDHSVVEISL
ncbi:MAG: DUF1835 domain-containing protein [Cellvibrionaceae bacterium]